MSQADDLYRTLKPTDDLAAADGTLAPRRVADYIPRRPPPTPRAVAPTLPPPPPAFRTPPPPPPARPSPAALAALVDLYHLMKQRRFADAVRLLAQALPRREAVAWACRCVRGPGGAARAADGAALAAAEAWAAAPSEARARAAGVAASAAGYGGAAGSVALAAFLSGGVLTAPGRPPTPFDLRLGARAVGNAVILKAEAAESGRVAECYRRFLKDGAAALTAVRRPR